MPTLDSHNGPVDPLAALPRAAVARPAADLVRSEFREMPGLTLTADQARRLFGLPARLCEHVLGQLVQEGFLRVRRGSYSRTGQA